MCRKWRTIKTLCIKGRLSYRNHIVSFSSGPGLLANQLFWQICLKRIKHSRSTYSHKKVKVNILASKRNKRSFKSKLKSFYRFYLSQHKNTICKRLHFLGNILIISDVVYCMVQHDYFFLFLIPVLGYGPAWTGHFFFEKNKPATFEYPLLSLICDWIMFKDILIGKIKI